MLMIMNKKVLAFSILSIGVIFNSAFAQEASNTFRAKIISVTPLTDSVLVIKSNCSDDSTISNSSSGISANTIIGAVIGGLLGRTVGSGTGKTVATVGGAIAGGVIANAMEQIPSDKKYQHIPNPCHNIKTYEPVPGGFEIIYELNGRQYSSRSNSYPKGDYIEVKMAPSIIE